MLKVIKEDPDSEEAWEYYTWLGSKWNEKFFPAIDTAIALNELMEKAEDPEKYYIEVIMQEKIKLYLEYVEKHSFFYDLGLIFKTFWVIVKER